MTQVGIDNHTFDQILSSFCQSTDDQPKHSLADTIRHTNFVEVDERLLEPSIEESHSLGGFAAIQ